MTGRHDADAAPANVLRALLDAMERDGVRPAEPLAGALATGRLVRFRAEGDKPGRRNGWARLHPDGWAFGHWRLDVRRSGRAAARTDVTPAERARWRRELAAAQALRARERAAGHDRARVAALALWQGAKAADGAHPCLRLKRMQPDGLRRVGKALLIPMRDVRTGALWNVQRVAPNGAKLFQPGGRVSGLVWGRGEPGARLVLCEGAATAAAVHAATGLCTIAAFAKGELTRAAVMLAARWPAARLVVGADLDADGGGEAAACEAARAVGGTVVLPPRPPGWSGPAWDYADLWAADGGAALIRAAFEKGDAA